MSSSDVLIITTDPVLDQWCAALESEDAIAVDTEGDSLHCYFEKLCLIQITSGFQSVLIDPLEPLDFSKFNAVLSQREIILHRCDYDLRMLRRGINFVPGEVFDTDIAARFVWLKGGGVSSLLKKVFGVGLPQFPQKAKLAERP